MSTLKSLLEEIKPGTTSFTPASSKENDIQDFQPIAKMLDFANNEGLLETYESHKESYSGNCWYDSVLVKGGLSHKGKKFLAEPSAETEKRMEDVIILKPNFHGIGIDLKALWQRWKNRKA